MIGSMCVCIPGWLRPRCYDLVMRAPERRGLAILRRELVGQVRGRTLEVGAGTGANLPWYPAAAAPLTLTEPDPDAARRLRARAASIRPDARVLEVGVDDLPFADGSFDTVVCTLVLCTVPDQHAALSEIHRVLRPDGVLVFVEHVRAHIPALARRQDRWRRPWRVLAGGCEPNRDTVLAIAGAGFTVSEVRRGHMPAAPAIVRPLAFGTATRIPAGSITPR